MGSQRNIPISPRKLSQGCLRILYDLQKCLLEITGMDAVTLQPAAGAQGELTGLLLIRAYLESQGNSRKKVLIPDSAHGTNPASRGDRRIRSTKHQIQRARTDSTPITFANSSPKTSPR